MHPMLILTPITYLSEKRLYLSLTICFKEWCFTISFSVLSEFHTCRLAGHMPEKKPRGRTTPEALCSLPPHPKAQKIAAQQPLEATSSGTSQVGGLVSPHGWSLEIRNMHNSLFEVWFHLLFGEACTKATSLKSHYNSFYYFFSIFSHW